MSGSTIKVMLFEIVFTEFVAKYSRTEERRKATIHLDYIEVTQTQSKGIMTLPPV